MTFLPSRLHDIRRARNLRRDPPSHYDAAHPKSWWQYRASTLGPRPPLMSWRQRVRDLQFAALTWLRDRTQTVVRFEPVLRFLTFPSPGRRYVTDLDCIMLPRTEHVSFELDGGQRYTSWYRLSGGNVSIVTNPWPFTGNPAYRRNAGFMLGQTFHMSWRSTEYEQRRAATKRAFDEWCASMEPPPVLRLENCSECPRQLTGGQRVTCSGRCRTRRSRRLAA